MVALRVYNGLFGPNLTLAALRFGDLIALCNYVEYLREKTDCMTLQAYVPNEVVFPSDHCIKFRDWLISNTDYITIIPDNLIEFPKIKGTDETYDYMTNLWNIRKDVSIRRQNVFDIEDRVILRGYHEKKDMIVIHPLVDAPYNADRNWGLELTQKIINSYQYYTQFDKVIISKEPISGLDIKNFRYSHDFYDNLDLICECSSYIGGDTGFSHFAGALSPGPKYCQYLYPKNTYGTTFPFNWKSHDRVVFFDDPKFTINNMEFNEIFLPIPVRTQ